MAESEKMNGQRTQSRVRPMDPDDEIVITGISGKFPKSENVKEFAENLYNKVM